MMKDKIELKKYYSTKEFLENYIYEENNLGVECTEEGTTFRLWSPQAEYSRTEPDLPEGFHALQ